MMGRPCYKNCIHYGTQFEMRDERREERREERDEFEDRRFRYPLYTRLRRHIGRRVW